MTRTAHAIFWALIFFLTAPAEAAAHALGQSYIFVRVYDDSIAIRVEMTVDDLDRVLGLGWNSEDGVTREQIGAHLDAILSYVRPRLFVGRNGQELPLEFTGYDLRDLNLADFVMLHYTIKGLDEIPDELEFGFPVMFEVDTDHRNMLVIEHNWKTATFNNEANVSLIFTPGSTRQVLDLSESSTLRGFLGFIRLGAWHIWIGIDHILFLVALILPSVLFRRAQRWEPVEGFRPALLNVVAIVTFFTIAHSITLSMAALDVVRLPSRLVEAIIAASIAAAALYNLYPRMAVREWMIAFVFGLFHGFGFANVLGEMSLGREYLVLSLLGFNLGVELGQVAIIALIFPVFFVLRARPVYPLVLRYGSVLLIAVAAFWFVERAFDLPLSEYARRAPGYVYRHLVASI